MEREPCLMLWVRFFLARVMESGEMSMPEMWMVGLWGDRRAWRRRGMQPVPVQRSRMRRICCEAMGLSFVMVLGWCEGFGVEADRSSEARWVVMVSVSGLSFGRV